MSLLVRRAVAIAAVAAGTALPMVGLTSAAEAATPAPAASHATPNCSLKNIDKVLDDIQKAKTPKDLEKQLDKDIATLKHNEACVPHKDKKDYNKFIQELRMAKEHHQLEGPKATTVLKKIQADAKKLKAELDKDAK